MSAIITLSLNIYPKGVDNTQRYTYVRGTLTVSASTYSAGGLGTTSGSTINWNFDGGVKVGTLPFQVSFFSVGNTAGGGVASHVGGGYQYVWNAATNKFQILAASGGAAGTGAVTEEMTDGTSIPAGVLNDVIQFEAIFVKNAAF